MPILMKRHREPPEGLCVHGGPELVALGAAVREVRVVRRLSQEELGFRGNLHRNYVGAIERGEINPTFRILRKLAKGLNIPMSELVLLYEAHLYRPLRDPYADPEVPPP